MRVRLAEWKERRLPGNENCGGLVGRRKAELVGVRGLDSRLLCLPR